MPACNNDSENNIISQAKTLYARYSEMEEIIRLGAYTKGADADLDKAIDLEPGITQFLRQKSSEPANFEQCYTNLNMIINR